jgi:hypothetical protein
MSGQFKPVAFEPYGSRRTRWRLPRWLVLLLGGIAIGAGGVVLIQERYLPPRLSPDESAKLRSAFEQTDAERLRLKGELGETAKQLETARAGMKGLQDELAASHATTERLRDDLASVIATLPPDPRGGVIEIRSGRFTVARGTLAYDVVLTRARGTGKPMTGVMQFTVTGESARGAETTVPLKPVDLSIGAHEIARGSLALPDGLTPRQVTIQVLDRIAGNSLGMRVMLVR